MKSWSLKRGYIINSAQLPDNISFKEDPIVEFEYFIPNKIIEQKCKNKVELVNTLWEFYNDYIDISQRYRIGEIIPQVVVDKHKLDLKKTYKKYIEHSILVNDYLSLFHGEDKDFVSLDPCCCWYHLLSKSQQVTSGYYSIERGSVNYLKLKDYRFLLHENDTFDIFTTGEYINNISKGDSIEDIGFFISIKSNFWFEEIDIYSSSIPYSNRYLAYHNTPRLNSFLRDLHHIWVEKYCWEFNSNGYQSKYSNHGGIPLGGKIIYQEDIDEGRVALPSIEEYLG